ncbi:hypothetical protein H8356DRAFT_1416161 [Neocallimastix lanati (nom. inval.)]|nr:hypothetical protein H8356DRAFT_1416161 [Neocallimastix sp. JGI-2020a]
MKNTLVSAYVIYIRRSLFSIIPCFLVPECSYFLSSGTLKLILYQRLMESFDFLPNKPNLLLTNKAYCGNCVDLSGRNQNENHKTKKSNIKAAVKEVAGCSIGFIGFGPAGCLGALAGARLKAITCEVI